MSELTSLIHQHPFIAGLLTQALITCAVTSLPSPDAKSGKFYLWFFNFSHSYILAVARIFNRGNGNGAPPSPPA